MPYAAISYNVKPGCEDAIAELFSGFQRVDSPVLRSEDGAEVGRLLGTAVFVADGLLVRFIHYEGELEDVGRHMSQHPGVHFLEEALKPYLAEPRDTGTPERFQAYFAKSLLRCVQQFSVPVPAPS
ncbi:MAG TPA: SchA/CurD-like domain-containing protein [Streptosporangiaceae bacterium]|nr:SchA/CurD-like domain-containing protein [Streptosporangiaceae bacterium]